jgi:Trk K+ transport system NAD-binding subunit
MNVVFAGADETGLAATLGGLGAEITRIEGIADRPALEDAGIHDADVFLITDVGQATSIVVARDLNPGIRVVAYTDDSLPEFVSGQRVVAMDPALLGPEALAEELVDG